MNHEEIDWQLSSYHYELPPHFVAQRPLEKRDDSRLLIYHQATDEVFFDYFYNLSQWLPPKSHLVLNESRVIPCRLQGTRPTGGHCEIFLLSLTPCRREFYRVLIGANHRKNIGDHFLLAKGLLQARVEEVYQQEGQFAVSFSAAGNPLTTGQLLEFLQEFGQLPIPPYIRQGQSDSRDHTDYQTLYANTPGSVAAPTAGLHFTPEVFQQLKSSGTDHSFVTLHVGAGTFSPVRENNIRQHKIHRENYSITSSHAEKIFQHQKNLIAVGTTSLRVLESCWDPQKGFIPPTPGLKSTEIFLYPGKPVHSVRGLITNFHLPRSTLLMLVSSLLGRKKTLELYQLAMEKNFRFFSYGDAMLILRGEK